jgi:ferrous iron transport protein B
MSPVTVGWLGLPAVTGILLIFGILRKELTLVMLGSIAGTLNFATVMTPVQMIVFTLVVMLYIPCVATIGVLVREIGVRKAAIITLFEVGFAILVGGIAFRLLTAF